MKARIQCPVVVAAALVLSAAASLVAANVCQTDRPIVNEDFEIICSKSPQTSSSIEVICKSAEPWSNLPHDKVNLRVVKETIFRNCSFPRDLSLYNVTLNLGLNNIGTLMFHESRSPLSRTNMRGFTCGILEFSNNSFGDQLPGDLLYDLNLGELRLHGLRVIPEGLFARAANLNALEISSNELGRLQRSVFDGLVNLQDLLLFDNKLETIELGIFDGLVNLRVLDIGKNRLTTLPSGLFRKLAKLQRITLSENDFTHLPDDVLRIEGSELQRVRLNHNRGGLASLPSGFFANLSSLSNIELISNNFTSIPADAFVGTKSLQTLNVSKNVLRELPQDLFQSTTSLSDLQLSHNELVSLPDGLFDETNLKRLYLNNNKLTNLSSGVLAGLSNLEILQASYNYLRYIDNNANRHVKQLQHVHLSHNLLTFEVPDSPSLSIFANCINIIEMDLSYNNISNMFGDWSLNGKLKDINLEGNKINYIGVEDINMLNFDANLNLRNNHISTVDLKDFEENVKKYRSHNSGSPNKNVKVYLENNPLNCDCKLLDFVRFVNKKMIDEVYTFVKFDTDELKCMAPPQIKNVAIANIQFEELKCLVESNVTNDACNDTCTCWEYPGKKVLSADCSYKNLWNVPALIENPHNWSIELDLTGNKLRKTPSLNHSYLLNVTVLDLSSNNISAVSMDVFSNSLRDLKLHNNSISRIDNKVLEFLSSDTALRNLTLHKNKWICDCEARNFLTVVQKKLSTLELHEVMCYGTNRRLSTMTVNELCEGAVVIIIVASLLIALFGVILGGLAALYYRYQKEIKVWLYSKQWCLWFVTEDELDRDKQYDAFISFSHKDEDFVIKEIVGKLEQGPKPFKLCLHYRDWLAGEWIPAQIARSVDESRRTIVVLSPNFLESIWGRMEFRTAHSQALSEGRARVIVILYGDIGNTEDLDPELKAYLSMNTYVKWGDPWFWDKLKYALPHRFDTSKRKTRNARIIENHLAQLPMNNHESSGKAEIIQMPKITVPSNDSAKLLDSGAEDERIVVTC